MLNEDIEYDEKSMSMMDENDLEDFSDFEDYFGIADNSE